MSNGVSVDIVGEEWVYNFLVKYPPEVQDAALDDAYKYLIDALRIQPPPKYVTRKAAYGFTFFSDKQRRWFFANLNEGLINVPYTRMQELRKGWKIKGSGQNAAIINEVPGAEFVVGDRQSRHEQKVGWKRYDQVIAERQDKITKIIEASVTKALKKLGA